MEIYEKKPTLATWVKDIKPSAMQEFLFLRNDLDFISFSLGLPDCSLFPIKLYEEAIKNLLKESNYSLQYSKPLEKLKEQIVSLMYLRGVICKTTEIFLTSGAQQGINLLARLLLNENSKIIVENLAYPGFIQAVESFSPIFLPVSTNIQNGINVIEVEKILNSGVRPSLIYVVSEGGNPHAVSVSVENKKKLASLSEIFCVPIIEDDTYGFLQYDDYLCPPIKSLNSSMVFYVGSFSKILAPSLRVGWLVIPEHLHRPLSILKESADINTATFSQLAISKLFESNFFEEHILELRNLYREKRDVMFKVLKEHLPSDTIINLPRSGLFFWVGLPKDIDAKILLEIASREYKVAFIPGESFSISKSFFNENFIRLNFSSVSIEKITEGVIRLKKAIEKLRKKESMQ